MTKITSYMRVTKQPKAHLKHDGKKVEPSHVVKKQQAKQQSKEEELKPDEEADEFIPFFIYETVKYKHKREPHEVSKELKIVIEYIQEHYDIPVDFERNLKFGAHSGLTYEKRLARAYSLGQLAIKKQQRGKKAGTAPQPICLTCAAVGHAYKYCPDGF